MKRSRNHQVFQMRYVGISANYRPYGFAVTTLAPQVAGISDAPGPVRSQVPPQQCPVEESGE